MEKVQAFTGNCINFAMGFYSAFTMAFMFSKGRHSKLALLNRNAFSCISESTFF